MPKYYSRQIAIRNKAKQSDLKLTYTSLKKSQTDDAYDLSVGGGTGVSVTTLCKKRCYLGI